jgi:large subunit ribosomal protein L6
MSRIGKKIIPIPAGVKVEQGAAGTGTVVVTGPKGSLTVLVHPHAHVAVADGVVTVQVDNPDSKLDRSLWGLTRSLVANAVTGVVSGFSKKLEIVGVAYRAAIAGSVMTMSLGFSHPVEVQVPDGLTVTIEKSTITISGIDKQLVGEFAANVRELKKPEPYKGKGIKYSDEVVRRKAGKVVKAVGGGK